jgi:hypothetical protein
MQQKSLEAPMLLQHVIPLFSLELSEQWGIRTALLWMKGKDGKQSSVVHLQRRQPPLPLGLPLRWGLGAEDGYEADWL